MVLLVLIAVLMPWQQHVHSLMPSPTLYCFSSVPGSEECRNFQGTVPALRGFHLGEAMLCVHRYLDNGTLP